MANDVNRLIDMLYERIEDAKSPALKPNMSMVDRDEVLDLLEGYLMPYGTVKTVLVEDDVAIITMSGMDLEQISAMFQRVQQQPIVKSASLTIAATPRLSRTDLLDFSVTITLQPADKEAAA